MKSASFVSHHLKHLMVPISLIIAIYSPSAHAIAICGVSALGPVITYDPSDPSDNITGVGTVTVSCLIALQITAVAYQVNLSTGLGSSSFSNRRMSYLSSNFLDYNLYTNASRTTIWGDGTGGTSTRGDSYQGLLGTTAIPYDVYVRIPRSQAVRAGGYTDTINITVIY